MQWGARQKAAIMRLPRYGLRTVFVLITLISLPIGWVAYQLNWKQQRYEFLVHRTGGKITAQSGMATKAPWSLRIFGEAPAIYLLKVSDADVQRARELFPEAIINPKPSDFPKLGPLRSAVPRQRTPLHAPTRTREPIGSAQSPLRPSRRQ